MNSARYFDYIEEKLNLLAQRINTRGKLNILNLHVHSENFYLHFLNKLYGWNLDNLNNKLQNVEAIDLVDHSNKYIVQVSATNTKEKIESALKKEIIKRHSDYTFKFISISKDADDLRTKKFSNPHGVAFEPANDIFDVRSILKKILSLNPDMQGEIYDFIKKELGGEIDYVKLELNLTTIINILARENLGDIDLSANVNSFEIDRKIEENELKTTKPIIEDYSKQYTRLERIYKEFDIQGANKSSSVLNFVRAIYIDESTKLKKQDADSIFLQVIETVITRIIQSANYVEIPIDELKLCAEIVVVDAFIRCKVFKNPESYNYVASR